MATAADDVPPAPGASSLRPGRNTKTQEAARAAPALPPALVLLDGPAFAMRHDGLLSNAGSTSRRPPLTEEPTLMNLQHLARWSSALALVASLAWAQEPTTPPASPAEAPSQPAPEQPAAEATPPPAPPAARTLRGRIVDTKTKDPLPGATVSIKGVAGSAT